jgi:hypothetical protein
MVGSSKLEWTPDSASSAALGGQALPEVTTSRRRLFSSAVL